MTLRFGILGGGSWATALAKILTEKNHTVNWWIRNNEIIEHIKTKGNNPHYLSTVNFKTSQLNLSNDLKSIFKNSDVIVIAIPSAYVEESLQKLKPNDWQDKKIVSAIKGILPGKNILLNYYLQKQFDISLDNYFAVLGPCHAEEVAAEKLSYLTFSGVDTETAAEIASYFKTDYINTIINHDI